MVRTTERSVTTVAQTAVKNGFNLRFNYEFNTDENPKSVTCSGTKTSSSTSPNAGAPMGMMGTSELDIRVSVTPENKLQKSINFNNVDIDGALANAIVAECIAILGWEETV